MSFKRAIIRLQLDREAKDALDELCHQRGMTQIAALSRLVRWFTRQDEVIQTAVLGSLSEESLQTLAQRLLTKIAAGEGRLVPERRADNVAPEISIPSTEP
jgi:hypothetical protein